MANHIAEVAQTLGVEIGEAFKITDDTHDDCQIYHRFTKNAGIEISDDGVEWKTAGTVILKYILIGVVGIVKLPWKPQIGEKYYIPSISNRDLYDFNSWNNDEYDKELYR